MKHPKGSYVIVDDCDSPVARNIARIGPDGLAHYLNRRWPGMALVDATQIEDFGVTIIGARVVKTSDAPIAAYRDGAPRRWQEPLPARLEFK